MENLLNVSFVQLGLSRVQVVNCYFGLSFGILFGLSSGISFGIFVPLAFSFAQFSSTHFLFWLSLRRRILSFFKKTKMIDQDESPAELKKECFPNIKKILRSPKKENYKTVLFSEWF